MAIVAGAGAGDLTGAACAMCDDLAACAKVWRLAHFAYQSPTIEAPAPIAVSVAWIRFTR